MSFFRVLRLAAPAERAMLQRAILFKILESLFASAPLGLAYLVCATLLGDQRAEAWLPGDGFGAGRVGGIIALLLLCYLGQYLLFYLTNLNGFTAGYRLSADLRVRIADHLRRLPISYFDRKEPGELAHTLMQDVMAIELIPGSVLPRIVAVLSFSAIGLLAVLLADWRMGLALALGLPLAIPALVLGYRTLSRRMNDQAGAMIRMNARLIEFIRGIGVIRAFGLMADRQGLCARAVDGYRDAAKRLVSAFVAPTILYPLALAIGPVAVLGYGAHRLAEAELSPAAYLFFVLLALRLFGALGELLDFSALTIQMTNALGRVTAILEAPAAPAGQQAIALPERFDIAFENVGFSYLEHRYDERLAGIAERQDTPRHAAVRDISFTAPERSMVALAGRSGAGKTTLVRLLQRHWPPDRGRITIGGIDLADWPEERLAQIISVVSQRVTLFSETVRDNVRLGSPDAGEEAVIEAVRAARCHDFVMSLPDGYDTVLANGGALLSGGERQRLALARAFLQDSRIIILDEATSSLDMLNERLVQEALDELLRDRTVIVIAHRLWTVRKADAILLLEDGALRERGTHDQLIAQPEGAYRRLWQELATAPGWQGVG